LGILDPRCLHAVRHPHLLERVAFLSIELGDKSSLAAGVNVEAKLARTVEPFHDSCDNADLRRAEWFQKGAHFTCS